jgi:hypothetical protein
MNNESGIRRHLLLSAACLILAMTATVVTAQTSGPTVTGKFSGLVYNRATQTFNSVLTLTNTGATTLPSPIVVVIATSTAEVTVAGTTDGATYIANLSDGSLAPGASTGVVVAFTDSTRVAFTPTITTIVTTDATSAAVIGIAGGTISVTNHLGDVLTLTIPPLALDQDTTISASALNAPLPNPIADNLYPGAILEPSGLQFSVPPKLTITAHAALTNPYGATIFWLQNSNHALPIANQNDTQNSVAGDIYHFSKIIAGVETAEEIDADIEWIIAEPVVTPGDLLDYYSAELGEAHEAQALGLTSVADFALFEAKWLVEAYTPELLADPLPHDPCGHNTIDVLRWADLVVSVLGDTSLADLVREKACTLNVTPQFLSLFQGETWQPGITATLLDPNSNQQSCGVINWYSSNLNVVDIAPNGYFCVPTGVGPGVANVSANCDGLFNSTKVSVCGLNGTWQGTYSGQTIKCVKRNSSGCCIARGGVKVLAGPITVTFNQNGTSVSASSEGEEISGTDINGSVSLATTVPGFCGTIEVPAGLDGTISSDCSTLSGSFYSGRSRAVTGTFKLQFIAP